MTLNTISLRKLYYLNFYIDDVFSMRQKWIKNTLFQMKSPRKRTAIIFLNNCTAVYTDKSGEQFFAPQKSVICLPQGSEYTCLNVDCTSTYNDAIIVEFIVKSNDSIITLSDKPFLIKDINITIVEDIFSNTVQACEMSIPSPLAVKTSVYKLLSFLCETRVKKHQQRFSVIETGIEAIESDPFSELSIEKIAKSCNVSSCYFRRLFKEYSGKNPNEYRMDLRYKMAKRMLENGDATIDYISDALGFESASYFCRIFKKKYGITPGQYQKENSHT